jgi:hypothetical protein
MSTYTSEPGWRGPATETPPGGSVVSFLASQSARVAAPSHVRHRPADTANAAHGYAAICMDALAGAVKGGSFGRLGKSTKFGRLGKFVPAGSASSPSSAASQGSSSSAGSARVRQVQQGAQFNGWEPSRGVGAFGQNRLLQTHACPGRQTAGRQPEDQGSVALGNLRRAWETTTAPEQRAPRAQARRAPSRLGPLQLLNDSLERFDHFRAVDLGLLEL